MNNFKECLSFSHEFEDHPIWSLVYKRAFPEMIEIVSYRQDGFWQREGIDRGVILSNTKQLFIDEKVRGRNKITGKVYEDIAIEVFSNEEKKTEGWAVKPLRADYIAYLIAPLGICYLLPVIQMQSAFSQYKDIWIKQYGLIKAKNNTYTTTSVPLPVAVLFKAIGEQLRITFKPFEIK